MEYILRIRQLTTLTVDYFRHLTIMIRIKFKKLISEKEFQEERVVTIGEISEKTGIHRATLSKIANERGCNTGTDNLNKLCRFFGCKVEELLTYIPDEDIKGS